MRSQHAIHCVPEAKPARVFLSAAEVLPDGSNASHRSDALLKLPPLLRDDPRLCQQAVGSAQLYIAVYLPSAF